MKMLVLLQKFRHDAAGGDDDVGHDVGQHHVVMALRDSIMALSPMTSPVTAVKRSAKIWLMAAFSRAISSALGSISTPVAWAAPSRIAVMDKMPLPLPRSSTRSPPWMARSSSRMHICVDACAPVPKIMPGSSRTSTRCSGFSGCSHSARPAAFRRWAAAGNTASSCFPSPHP